MILQLLSPICSTTRRQMKSNSYYIALFDVLNFDCGGRRVEEWGCTSLPEAMVFIKLFQVLHDPGEMIIRRVMSRFYLFVTLFRYWGAKMFVLF